MSKEYATLKQTIEASKLVEEHCSKSVDGFAVWDKGWDDLAVAKAVGLSTPSRVAHIRKEIVGPLRRAPGTAQQSLQRRIEVLERTIANHAILIEGLLNSRKGD